MDTGLFEGIMDSAILLDKAGRIINLNGGAASLFGYSKKELIGRPISILYNDHLPFTKLIQEISSSHKRWQKETVFLRKNGVKGHCKSYLSYLHTHHDDKVAALLIHQNISSQKKVESELHHIRGTILGQLENSLTDYWSASMLLMDSLHSIESLERKLRDSELRFHLLAENATDMISRHLPDGTFLYVSPASKTTMGYNHEDLLDKNFLRYIHHDDFAKFKRAFSRKRENPDQKPIVYRIRRKDGEFRWIESNIRLIMNENRRQIHEVQLASRDITDRVLDKKARLRGQQLAHVFRLSTMEEMASGMAHEISQPLAAIVNYTRGCVRHLENNTQDHSELRHVMGKAVAQAERAGEIIQRLKNFFCKGQLVKTSCRINNVVRETINLIKNELSISKTKTDIDIDKDIPFIFIDKIQIQQVLLNLIQNAIESMQQNHVKEKRIYIQTKMNAKNMLELTITDTGPGFPKDHIHKVFMPFFTTKAHGRGMGLAICRSIIEAHGGEFTINPNVANNSWIRFSLPINAE